MNATVEELANLPAKEYLERFHVDFYLQDLTSLFLARKRSEGRIAAADFACRYFEALLRGEHVQQRSFKYVNATARNRRAFVKLMREALRGVGDPAITAVTAYDFQDLLQPLCSDLPMALVQEAARHAQPADGDRHCLLGEALPFGASLQLPAGATALPNCEDSSAEGSRLLTFQSLQRMTEFSLVYAELLEALKHMFREDPAFWPPPRAGALRPSGCKKGGEAVVLWQRGQLVSELKFYLLALPGAALPSEQALRRIQRPPGAGPSLSFVEALQEMAECFELELEPSLEGLAGLDSDALLSSSGPVSSNTAASTERGKRERPPRPKSRG